MISDSQLVISLMQSPEVDTIEHAKHEEDIEYGLEKPAESWGMEDLMHTFCLTYFHYCPTKFPQSSYCFSSS